MTSTPNIPPAPDFHAGAKTKDVPIARLIGFESEEIADGKATVTLTTGPQHANPSVRCTAEFSATLRTPHWVWHSRAHWRRRRPLRPWN